MSSKRKSQTTQSGEKANKVQRSAPPAVAAVSDDDDFISDDGDDLIAGAVGKEDEEDSGDSADDDFQGAGGGAQDVDEGESGSEEDDDLLDDAMESDGGDDEEGPVVARTYETKKGSSLYQAPTNEEMQTLKSGSTLFKSSLFSLQLSLLLPSLRPLSASSHPTPPTLSPLLSTLQLLRPFLLALPTLAPTTPRLSLSQYPNLPYPSPGPPDDAKWLMTFLPPKEVQIVGDWALETCSHSAPKGKGKAKKGGKSGTVEMALMMDEEAFQEKDFLNGRYFYKRVYWLTVVGEALKKGMEKLGLGGVEWAVEGESEWKPVLVLRSKQDKSASDFSKLNLTITLRPTIPSTLFPPTKLSPARNSLRPPTTTSAPPPPTPLYNTTLLSDTLYASHLLYLHNLSLALPSFKDASLLLQLWGSQRGFGTALPWPTTTGGWSTWSEMVLGYLVFGGGGLGKVEGGKRLGKGMSSYQVFRGALDFFAKHDFFETPVFMKNTNTNSNDVVKKIPQEEFTSGGGGGGGVFVEPTGSVNLLAGVEQGVLELMKQEAKTTLVMLDGEEGEGEGEDVFEGVFLRDLKSGVTRFDLVFRIDLSTAKPLLQPPLARLDQPSRLQHLINSLSAVVRRALNTRAKVVVVQQPSTTTAIQSWAIGSPRPSPSDESYVVELGVILDPTECTRLVDHGPSAEDVQGSSEFRDFWGEKSELRRFKDGRILESVVWEVGQSTEDRSFIVGRSVRHILLRHFGLEEAAIGTESSTGYIPFVRLPTSAVNLVATEEGSKVEGFRPAMAAFAELVKTLKGMEDLPLSLLNVFPVAEGLRYTSVFPPVAIDVDRFSLTPDCLKFVEALDVVVQFESSGRWPDELAAIQKIKLAFFEKIARSFRDKVPGSVVSVAMDDVLDGSDSAGLIEDNCALEIFVPSGFAFRLRIHHDREKTLLDRLIADKKTTKPNLRRAAQQALDLHLVRFTHLPRHHSAISAVHHLYPSFSTTVRLVKRWFSSHMLATHVPAELIELICASVYLTPSTHLPPASHSTGFARVIALLGRWKWKTSPLLVPLYSVAGAGGEGKTTVVFPKERRGQAMESFKKMRAADPNVSQGALFVGTEEDVSGRVFGARKPSRVVAMRMGQVAKATLQYLEENERSGELKIEHLFKTPLTDYSFLLHLDPSVLPRLSQAVSPDQARWTSKYKNVASIQASNSVYGRDLRIDFDPARQYFKDLERIYGESFILFHDPLGGSVIAGIWNPSLQEPRNFKVQLGFSSRPFALEGDSKSQMVRLNEKGVIAEAARLGEGLVEKVEVSSA